MSLDMAFGINEEDITTVLRQNAAQVANTNGVPFDVLGEQLFNDWTDLESYRVAKAALEGGLDLDEQTEAAYMEIRAILVEKGVLKR